MKITGFKNRASAHQWLKWYKCPYERIDDKLIVVERVVFHEFWAAYLKKKEEALAKKSNPTKSDIDYQ